MVSDGGLVAPPWALLLVTLASLTLSLGTLGVLFDALNCCLAS